MPMMTRAEYARHRGVSKPAVFYAIRDGRISTTIDPATQRIAIDSDVADVQWYSNTAHEKKQGTPEGNQPKPLPHELPPREVLSTDPLLPEREAQNHSAAASYSTNRAIKEHFNARLAKLDFEEKSGRMVDAQAVQNEAFKTARTVRDAMLSIADRISAELAATTDQFRVHKMLSDEIRKALESLKDAPE